LRIAHEQLLFVDGMEPSNRPNTEFSCPAEAKHRSAGFT
jgi:hypothetical protein